MTKFIKIKMVTILVSLMASFPVFAGHGVGNGGDHIRATFIRLGHLVINYLQETQEGQAILQANHLDPAELARVLSIDIVQVQYGILVDNSGSVVDAIGEKDKIVLANDRWTTHFENDRDVYFLIFHEMLRALEVNDDNYIISTALTPFPASRRVITRLASLYPILGETPLDQVIDVEDMVVEGSGCSSQVAGTFIDFDTERNVLNIQLQRYDLVLTEALAARKTCMIVLPINPPVGKRVSITQLDFTAKSQIDRGTTVQIAANYSVSGSAQPTNIKKFVATEPTQGRLLLRVNNSPQSNCSGQSQLLRINTATSIKAEQLGTTPTQLVADQINVSFKIEDCSSKR